MDEKATHEKKNLPVPVKTKKQLTSFVFYSPLFVWTITESAVLHHCRYWHTNICIVVVFFLSELLPMFTNPYGWVIKTEGRDWFMYAKDFNEKCAWVEVLKFLG